MNILGIGGSPRVGGNTDTLLDGVLSGAIDGGARTEKIVLNLLNFRPCQECGGCDRAGICVIEDDMKLVYAKVAAADNIVVATPLFFRNVSAQLKTMIDRFHCRWIAYNVLKNEFPRKGRKGVFICAASDVKDKACDNARTQVKAFFNTAGFEYFDELICRGVTGADDVNGRKELVVMARDIGRRLADAPTR